jgi:predicted PurR-regulated permease PerM
MDAKTEPSVKIIGIAVLLVAGVWLVYQIRDILYLLFIAFLLMTAMHPPVIWFERLKIPRFLSVLITYALIFGGFGFIIASSIPSLVVQTTRLVQNLPQAMAKVIPYWNIDSTSIGQQLGPIGENIIKVTVGIFSNLLATVTVLVFTFYFLLERRHTKEIITGLVGDVIAEKTVIILREVEIKLGAWVRGELLLMCTIGVLVYIGLMILHVEFALPIALIAGALEIIPNIGPIISAIPAVLIALSVSPLFALSVVALYIVVQQVENNIIVPIIMKRSIGFSPIVSILAIMIGGRLAGVTGAILAVPVLIVCQVLVNKLFIEPSSRTKNPKS